MKTDVFVHGGAGGMMALAPATYNRAAARGRPDLRRGGQGDQAARPVTAYEGTRDGVLKAWDWTSRNATKAWQATSTGTTKALGRHQADHRIGRRQHQERRSWSARPAIARTATCAASTCRAPT
jgi:hypothetical protein